MTDPLPEIKARPYATIIQWQKDRDWLVGEIERLRRLVDKPLFAIWQQVEAETREKWFGEHDLREENRRLRAALRDVLNHIGPHGAPPDCSNDCEGCRAEMAEASRIAEEALATATRPISDPPEGERP